MATTLSTLASFLDRRNWRYQMDAAHDHSTALLNSTMISLNFEQSIKTQ